MKNLFEILSAAATEEELKNFFAKFFRIKLSTKNFIDLYTPQILFKFKLNAPLKNPQTRAAAIAQMLYYIRRLKFGNDALTPSNNVCIVTKFAAVFFPIKIFADFYNDNSKYDWDLKPSLPCKKLNIDIECSESVRNVNFFDFSDSKDENNFIKLIKCTLIERFNFFERKLINENNFSPIFQLWQKLFDTSIESGKKLSEYFITDIEEGKSQPVDNGVLFHMSDGDRIEKLFNPEDYKFFWSRYEKISDPRAVIAIRQKMDRMSEFSLRRSTGEFFTPIEFANKAVEYLLRTVNFLNGEYRIWDMAAGTGNLEFALPAEALKFCYISTLLEDDVDYCKKIFPEATVFQYDYLNDDVNFFGRESIMEILEIKRKMPEKLLVDLKNPKIKWVIFINPPYANSCNFERLLDRKDKGNVSTTEIRKLMRAEGMAEGGRELFSQFIYRISREFSGRLAWLGIFSKLKYIISDYDQSLRDKVFRYKFRRGFLFNSKSFEGCRSEFPVGFLIWNLLQKVPLEEQKISLDVYNERGEKIAEKIFCPTNRKDFLNKWISRVPNVKKLPPLSSALNIVAGNKNRRDRVAENFLASFICVANDFAHQHQTSFLSAPYVSAGALSVTPQNFEQAMIIHMVRRLPKANWLNDKDQFMQPTKELSREFISDAVIWSLFALSNQTVSLRNVEYEGEVYRIRNNFFPFELEELRTWEISDADIRTQIFSAQEDRFSALWIKNNRLSTEAAEILDSAREIYKKFYSELEKLDVRKFKIENWDAGWYQIRMSLGETLSLEKLSAKLLPQIYELGFLHDEVRYF